MKTKAQKHKEALQRNRLAYPAKVKQWFLEQPGGDWYQDELKECGKEAADAMATEATRRLRQAAHDAHVDIHGNPLEEENGLWKYPQYRGKDLPCKWVSK